MAKRKVLMVLDNYIKEDIEIDDKFHFDLYKDDYKDKWINLLVKVDEFDDYDKRLIYKNGVSHLKKFLKAHNVDIVNNEEYATFFRTIDESPDDLLIYLNN